MVKKTIKNRVDSTTQILDADLETRLIARQLVSEVRKKSGHISLTLTDLGVEKFAEAIEQSALEKRSAINCNTDSLFPISDGTYITKKEAMIGFNVSYTSLWKWQKSGFLVPIKIGKRVYYRREDIAKITNLKTN